MITLVLQRGTTHERHRNAQEATPGSGQAVRTIRAGQVGRGRQQLFEQIADKLAIHAAIEERHFYPSVKNKATDDLLLESVEEHLEMKRIIADLLRLDSGGTKTTPPR